MKSAAAEHAAEQSANEAKGSDPIRRKVARVKVEEQPIQTVADYKYAKANNISRGEALNKRNMPAALPHAISGANRKISLLSTLLPESPRY